MSYPTITTSPPLGQLTLVPPNQERVFFILVIEWNSIRPPFPFEATLCLSPAGSGLHPSQWDQLPLSKCSSDLPNLIDPEHCHRAVYSREITQKELTIQNSSSRHCLFTVKFRVNDHAPWQFLSIVDGIAPGELLLQQASPTDVLHKIELTTDWTTKQLGRADELVKTYLVESKSPIKTTAGLSALALASIPSTVRHFSLVRMEPYWLGPRHGKGAFYYSGEDAVSASFLLDDGLVVTFVVLGWSDDVYQIFQNDEKGRIVVAAQNDTDQDRPYQVVMSAGADFEQTMKAAMDQVRSIVSSSTKFQALQKSVEPAVTSLKLQAVSTSTTQWLDSLTFCTWNALGQDLTESKILTALAHLKSNGINISTLLIDDNWQTLGPTKYDFSQPHYRGWSAMEANPSIAPSGLKSLITSIRAQYPEIQDIGVWHALMGYWGCLSATGPLAAQYPTVDVDSFLMGNMPAKLTSIAPDALHQFYDDFYAFLKDCGLTFVKTDVQHMLSMYRQPTARQTLISTYQSAWTAAYLTHFAGKAISCMAQIPQTMFHSLAMFSSSRADAEAQAPIPPVVLRNSNDFFPEIPQSQPWHIWCNAHNAHFTRHLNVVLDWDMFQTSHQYSGYHAAARCVSGGPILITDVPGEHDIGLIHEMTGRSPRDGRAIALRTTEGVKINVFDMYTDEAVVKIKANADTKRTGGVLMGVFNVVEREVKFLFDTGEFGYPTGEATQGGGGDGGGGGGSGDGDTTEILVRGHRTGAVFGPIALGEPHDEATRLERLVHVRLPARGYDVLTAQPVHVVQTAAGTTQRVCVMGLLGKMSGAAAITALSVCAEGPRTKIRTSLKALGTLGIWLDGERGGDKVEVRVQGSVVEEAFTKAVTSPQGLGTNSGVASQVWEIDLEGLWTQKNLWAEQCHEINVEVVTG